MWKRDEIEKSLLEGHRYFHKVSIATTYNHIVSKTFVIGAVL